MSVQEEIPSLEQLITFSDDEFISGEDVDLDMKPTEEEEAKESAEEPKEEETTEVEETKEESEEEEVEPKKEVEETTEEKVENIDDKESEESTEKTGDNVYNVIYDHLKEAGSLVLPDDFEFDGSPKKLEEAFNESEKNKWEMMREKLLSSIPEEGKPLLNYFIAGGKDINKYLETYGELDLETVDITNTKDQKRVLSEYYKRTTNYNEDKINKIIDKLESLDSLEDDAAEAVRDLLDLREEEQTKLIQLTEAENIAREKAFREEREALRTSIDKSDFIQDKRKNQVKAFLFNQVTRDNQTTSDYNRALAQISSNPEHIAQLADILLDYNPKAGFNMERFETRGKSSANKTFRDTLESKLDPKSKIGGKGSSSKKELIDWEELINQAETKPAFKMT